MGEDGEGREGRTFQEKDRPIFLCVCVCVCVRVCACVHISVRPIGTATFNAVDGNI